MIRYIYICSPYRGDIKKNIKAAQRYCKATIADYPDDEVIPVAPHLYFTQFLDDDIPEQREVGLMYGLSLLRWMARAAQRPDISASIRVFGDKLTEGMRGELELADNLDIPEERFPADYGLKKPRKPTAVDPAFEAFWTAYPYKIKKQEALSAWKKLRPDAEKVAAIMARLRIWKNSWDWKKEDGRYVPYPASWLNGGMYDAMPRNPRQPAAQGRSYHYTDYAGRGYDEQELIDMGLPMPEKY